MTDTRPVERGADRGADRLSQTLADFSALLEGRFRRLDPRELERPEVIRAASLILARLGKPTPVMISPAPEESEAGLLLRFAATNRMRIRHVTLEDGRLPPGEPMLLAFTQADHRPVVLLPGGGRLVPSDAHAARPRRLRNGEGGALERGALAFHPLLPDGAIPWKAIAFFGIGSARGEILPFAAMSLLAALLSMATPSLMGVMVTAISRAQTGYFSAMIAALALALVCQSLLRAAEQFAMARIEARSSIDLQAALVDRALRLPASAFRTSTHVILATQLETVDKLRRGMLRFAMSGVVALLNGIAAATVLAFLQLPAAAVAVLLGLALCLVAAAFGWRQFRAIYEGERMDVIVLAFVYDLILLVPVMRAMARERAAFIHWGQNFLAFQSRLMRAATQSNRYAAVVSAWEPATLALCFAVIAFAGSKGALGVGAALGFVSALGRLTAASQGVAAAIMGAAKSLPMAKLSKSFLEHRLEPPSAGAPISRGAGALAIANLSFGYGGQIVLRDVSLTIEGGSFVGIMGPSGAGKSTLVRLLLGLETPQAGAVFLDGTDLRKLDRQQLSGAVGLVMQDARPLSGPVLSSIRGIRDITIDRAWELARIVGLDAEIRAMPMGIHTVLGDGGAGFSAAQIQRLRIARALASKPMILVLDESISAIPPPERRDLLDRIGALGMTRLLVSHDLSALATADRILLVRDGAVADLSEHATAIAG
jgi:ABC-type bacteriocin/lantibiotic exporter with double-glycine peptidase domain